MMKANIAFRDLGLMDFKKAWEFQEDLFNERVQQKLHKRQHPESDYPVLDNILLFVEHPHVFTLGKSGNHTNLLISEEFLRQIDATYYPIDRGGDITYHGPGQIVAYPIFDLEHFDIHLKQYVYGLEESVILFLKKYGINASRMDGATGVWIEAETHRARKICAIGVKGSRHITMHGFAFNVNTNLDYFSYINPCGFQDKGVTSMEKETGASLDIAVVKQQLKTVIVDYFLSLT